MEKVIPTNGDERCERNKRMNHQSFTLHPRRKKKHISRIGLAEHSAMKFVLPERWNGENKHEEYHHVRMMFRQFHIVCVTWRIRKKMKKKNTNNYGNKFDMNGSLFDNSLKFVCSHSSQRVGICENNLRHSPTGSNAPKRSIYRTKNSLEMSSYAAGTHHIIEICCMVKRDGQTCTLWSDSCTIYDLLLHNIAVCVCVCMLSVMCSCWLHNRQRFLSRKLYKFWDPPEWLMNHAHSIGWVIRNGNISIFIRLQYLRPSISLYQ